MFGEQSAIQNVANHVVAAHGANPQLNKSVAQQNLCAGAELGSETGERGGNTSGRARDIPRCDDDGAAGFQQNRFAAFQASGADLRTLQILENADGAMFAFRHAAQALDIAGVIFVGAVGKVEAGDVHAQAQQVAHGSLGVAGGTDGADDFGAAGNSGFAGSRKISDSVQLNDSNRRCGAIGCFQISLCMVAFEN